MFGGVSQTYCLWKIDGEPFKKGNNYYVKVLHPITKLPKEVRWYKDKAHNDLMPKPKSFIGKIFGFKSETDSILMIQSHYLSLQEEENYFYYKWRFCELFGGIWYAPVNIEIPPIRYKNQIQKCSWESFKNEHKELV